MKKQFSISLMVIIAGTFLFTIPSYAQDNVKKWPVSDNWISRKLEFIYFCISMGFEEKWKKII